MKISVFSTKNYDRSTLDAANAPHGHEMKYLTPHLSAETASLAQGSGGVCVFVNDQVDRAVLELLHELGCRLVALRCAGFNNVDIAAARELGITVARVPAYSPYAVAEHTIGLILSLNRKIHRAYNRVREGNFALDGLLGFDLHEKKVGIVGTGKIGEIMSYILRGFGCTILGYDPVVNPECEKAGVTYVPLERLLRESDIISLHCPLTEDTYHMINRESVAIMKDGVMLINTSRGMLIDTRSVIDALKSGRIGYLGLDVYEEEADLFFENLSEQVIQDDVFSRLLTFPNVVITGHQGYFTREALSNIAETTVSNISAFERGEGVLHTVTPEMVK